MIGCYIGIMFILLGWLDVVKQDKEPAFGA